MINNTVFLTISEQIANQIRNEIIYGILKEGTPLKEVELSKKFKVSRGPIRDALKVLSNEGFLISKPNVGVKVAPQPGKDVVSLIVNFRKQIELLTIENYLDQFTEDDINDMKLTVENLRNACEREDIFAVVDFDIQFHSLIVQKHEDNHLFELWSAVVSRMMVSYTRLGNLMDCYYEHKNILQAIEEGDKQTVLTLLEKNIQ